MSMEINVLFRGTLPAKAALARAMKELGFPLTIPPPAGSLEKQKGFLPMRLRREETGAEFDVFEGRDNVKEVVGKRIKKIDPAFDRSANFRFGGDENEMIAATCAGARVVSLVLAGERDRAAEYVAQVQSDETMNGYAKEFVRKQWDRVSGDIEALCKKFHAQEAATVKALKLEHIWEPSPFPVELPAAQRARVGEPSFSKAPWISTPSWLYGEMPERPGEVRFGKSIRSRNGRAFFVIPLTREEAKKRHLASEPYARAERLADGTLLRISRDGADLNDPEKPQNPNYRPSTELHITWVKSPYTLRVGTSRDYDDPSMIVWWRFGVSNHETGKDIWLSYADGRRNERTIHDWRSGKKVYSSAPHTAAERKLVKCRLPGFGNYTKLLRRISSLLEIEGYGPWP